MLRKRNILCCTGLALSAAAYADPPMQGGPTLYEFRSGDDVIELDVSSPAFDIVMATPTDTYELNGVAVGTLDPNSPRALPWTGQNELGAWIDGALIITTSDTGEDPPESGEVPLSVRFVDDSGTTLMEFSLDAADGATFLSVAVPQPTGWPGFDCG